MKSKIKTMFQLILLLAALFSLTGGLTHTVHAENCSWLGINSTWGDINNWSCEHVPTTADDVVIPVTAHDPIINYTDKYVVYADNLTIQSGAAISVPERLEIIASNVDVYGTLETTGTMDSAYIRGYATINNYGLINAHAGSISISYGGTHTGTFEGQYGEITIGGDNFYPHIFSPTSNIFVKKITFAFNKPINIQGTFRQLWPESRVTVDHSDVTISNLTNLKIGSVTKILGSLTIGMSGTTTGSVNVPTSTSLVGTGTVDGDLTNAGTVSPGTSPGMITVDGDYTQGSDGTLTIELGGTEPGTEYDQLIVTGTASMSGTLEVSIINEFSPQIGDTFTILPYGTRSGGFTTMNMPEGYRWGISYGYYGLDLTVLEGGSIQGTVICDSTHTVFVDLYVGDANPPPEESTHIACDESYNFSNLPDGTYYLGAWIDLNESGGGPPDDGEPFAWYGEPTAVTIIDGETKTDIDITIEGAGYSIFLPLILR